jgi:ATP-binding cassette subfamily B protein
VHCRGHAGKKPAILIHDDSTSAVDSATRTLSALPYGKPPSTTVIIIAQRISSVRYADKIVILEDGTSAAEGTHERFSASSGYNRR